MCLSSLDHDITITSALADAIFAAFNADDEDDDLVAVDSVAPADDVDEIVATL